MNLKSNIIYVYHVSSREKLYVPNTYNILFDTDSSRK